ncbi:hypothetical protein L7F22_045699 [Adiantum nelumboides]|nr:hypothetical protein [Adiantum nelumboides]
MEKEAEYQGWSPRSLQHDKRKTVRKEVCAKSAWPRQGHKMYHMTLEKDIAKLQRQLKQEVDTHRTLERALTRTLGALPRFSPGLTTEVQKLVAEVAVLEEEVVHLEEYLTILHQELLHNDALNSEMVPKLRSETFAEGQPATSPTLSTLTTVKRSSVIASLLPSTVDNMRAKPIFLGGSPTYGQLKQKLSRSSSFRRESSNVRSIHGTCYG